MLSWLLKFYDILKTRDKDFARILHLARILGAFLHDLAECLARILHSTSYKILLLASPCKTSHQNLAK